MRKIGNSVSSCSRLFFAIILLISACGEIRLISDYDEIIDRKVSELHQKFALHFVQLERMVGTEDANYENFTTFYDEVKVDVRVLRVRAGVIDKNDILIRSLDLLDSNISDLESLHKTGFRQVNEIVPIRNALDSSFASMIRFITALKRGR
jgi:hypothetical protein